MYILIDGAIANETIIKGDYTNPSKVFDYMSEVEDYLSKMYTQSRDDQLDIGSVEDFLNDFVLYYVESEEEIELQEVNSIRLQEVNSIREFKLTLKLGAKIKRRDRE